MDKEYQAVQAECVELQSLLDQKDDQLCSLNQDLMDLTRRMKVCLLHSCTAETAMLSCVELNPQAIPALLCILDSGLHFRDL